MCVHLDMPRSLAGLLAVNTEEFAYRTKVWIAHEANENWEAEAGNRTYDMWGEMIQDAADLFQEIVDYMAEEFHWDTPGSTAWWSMVPSIKAKIEAKKLEEANAEADAIVAEIEEMIAEGVPETTRHNKIEDVEETQERHRERQKVTA